MPTIMLSAMEVSGDMHGAHLARALRERDASVRLIGIGGDQMKAAGVDVCLSTAHLGVIGAVEGIRQLPQFLRLGRQARALIESERPDLLVLIDSRDFNIGLIGTARAAGARIAYYVAPPVWAWPDHRMLRLARRLDKIIAVFPFEERLFHAVGAPVEWVGHPLRDLAKPSLAADEARSRFDLPPGRRLVGLMPGSRKWEITHLLPIMLASSETIRQRIDSVQFLLRVADNAFRPLVQDAVAACGLHADEITVLGPESNVYDMMSICELLITSSGTATLEATCLGTPMVIVYRAHLLTYLLGRLLVRVSHVGLPNIIAGREIVPELLQSRVNTREITETAVQLLDGEERIREMKRSLERVRESLGPPGAIGRAAKSLLELIEGGID